MRFIHSGHRIGYNSDNESRTVCVRKVIRRFLLFLFFWWVLVQGELASLLIGIPTVMLATIVSLWLCPSWRWRFIGLLRFVPLFAYDSLKGGLDVAGRALRPNLPLAPAILEYSLQLRDGTARVFFANIVSLLPGTLSADICGDTLLIHVLDRTMPVLAQLQRLEMAVAQLFDCLPSALRVERAKP